MLVNYLIFLSFRDFRSAWWLSIVQVNFPIVTKPILFFSNIVGKISLEDAIAQFMWMEYWSACQSNDLK